MIRELIAASLLTGFAGAAAAQGAGKADPPGTGPFMAQYRAWFAGADRNRDGSLDKQELAVAFRGAAAKPFDYVPESAKPPVNPNYSRYPDFNLLTQLDKNRDEAISRNEFENWAGDLARQLKEQADAQKKILEAQLRLQRQGPKLKPNDKKKLENDLNRQRDQAKKMRERIEQLEKNLRQAQKKNQDRKKK